ncbi:MAG TPA: O-antigen ligase family protein [Terriglobia bacterium]|nr:O-antigen ligase family protein [Terriglobia bacterium]
MARINQVLTGLLLAAPLAFGAVQPWAWGGMALIACLLSLWWLVKSIRQSAVTLVWSPLYLPGLLFLFLGMAQLAAHGTLDTVGTREALIRLASDLTFFFLATQCLAVSQARWAKLGLAVTVFAFVLALFALIQFLSDPTRIYWLITPRWPGWIFGPYVNHNHYAGLMEMLIPVSCAYVWTRRQTRPARLLASIAVLIPAASVLMSGSRGGCLALGVETCLLVGILLHSAAGNQRLKLALYAVLGVAGVALTFLWMDTTSVTGRLAMMFEPSSYHEAGWTSRRVVALDSLRILRDHPGLGTGLGSFEVAYPRYQSFPGDETWDHAHNDFVEALAETGLAGGLLIAAALILFLRLAFTDLRERLRNPIAWLQIGAAVGCCGLLVHSLFDFNLHIPANAAWFAVWAAWGACGPPAAPNWACLDPVSPR